VAHGRSLRRATCPNLGSTLGTRIQLCGRLFATIDGTEVGNALPGRQGRLLFAFLVVHRLRASSHDELVDAVWPEDPPRAADAALYALVSKVRRVIGADRIEGRRELRLVLPEDAWVDVEAAPSAIHRAESAVAREDWPGAWVAARIAQHISVRPFLAGLDAEWIEEVRRDLEGIYLRSVELATDASLRIGGNELATAERGARLLVRRAPFRESGYRYLMEALVARGNAAEALQVYEQLRTLLREELGAAPSPATQQLHRTLLG
jgi:DNA-binding SARP family transcriptional activator